MRPGTLNPAVPGHVAETICSSDWLARAQRLQPPTILKDRLLIEYQLPGNPATYSDRSRRTRQRRWQRHHRPEPLPAAAQRLRRADDAARWSPISSTTTSALTRPRSPTPRRHSKATGYPQACPTTTNPGRFVSMPRPERTADRPCVLRRNDSGPARGRFCPGSSRAAVGHWRRALLLQLSGKALVRRRRGLTIETSPNRKPSAAARPRPMRFVRTLPRRRRARRRNQGPHWGVQNDGSAYASLDWLDVAGSGRAGAPSSSDRNAEPAEFSENPREFRRRSSRADTSGSQPWTKPRKQPRRTGRRRRTGAPAHPVTRRCVVVAAPAQDQG